MRTAGRGGRLPLPLLLVVLTGALILALRCAYRIFYRSAYPVYYQGFVEKYSEANSLDSMLVYAVIHTESGFRPNVESSVGARGLMQLTEDTFEWARYRMGDAGDGITYESLFEPEVNIRYGTAVLRLLIEEFGDEETALAAYHAGWGSVKKWLADPRYSRDGVSLDRIPFLDTGSYVPKVMGTRAFYHRLYA